MLSGSFISTVIDRVEASHDIDHHRVFAAGHSNGAIMSYRLACELADKIVAIGVQAGALEVQPCHPALPVAAIEIHGTADQNIPIDGGKGSAGISQADFRPVHDAIAAREPEVTALATFLNRMGAHILGAFGNGKAHYAVSAINGAGYKTMTRSQGLDLDTRIDFEPVNGLTLALFYRSGKRGLDKPSITTFHTADRTEILAAYVKPKFRVGAEFFDDLHRVGLNRRRRRGEFSNVRERRSNGWFGSIPRLFDDGLSFGTLSGRGRKQLIGERMTRQDARRMISLALDRFAPGDAFFVAAGVEHRFENFSTGFSVWVVFWGPSGGELAR